MSDLSNTEEKVLVEEQEPLKSVKKKNKNKPEKNEE